jgi:hypothetical protein
MESGKKAIEPLRHHTDYRYGLIIARQLASFLVTRPFVKSTTQEIKID